MLGIIICVVSVYVRLRCCVCGNFCFLWIVLGYFSYYVFVITSLVFVYCFQFVSLKFFHIFLLDFAGFVFFLEFCYFVFLFLFGCVVRVPTVARKLIFGGLRLGGDLSVEIITR